MINPGTQYEHRTCIGTFKRECSWDTTNKPYNQKTSNTPNKLRSSCFIERLCVCSVSIWQLPSLSILSILVSTVMTVSTGCFLPYFPHSPPRSRNFVGAGRIKKCVLTASKDLKYRHCLCVRQPCCGRCAGWASVGPCAGAWPPAA